MSTTARRVLAILIALVGILAVTAALIFWRSSSPEEQAHPTPTPSASAPAKQADPRTPEAALTRKFLTAYAQTSDPEAWIAAMQPHVTPQMLASLRTSDPHLPSELGTTIISADGPEVTIGTGSTPSAVVHVSRAPADEGETEEGVLQIEYIDIIDPPDGAALPLNRSTAEQVRTDLHDPIAAIASQDADTTNEVRADTIAMYYTDGTNAQKAPRLAPEGTAVTIGNLHDVQLSVSDEGNLLAVVVVPWQTEGAETSWQTYTITLERAADGTWQAKDVQS